MFSTRAGFSTEVWDDDDAAEPARHSALIQCAIARSVLGAARSSDVPIEPRCEESLMVVERWCQGDATAADVRTAAREVTLRLLEVRDETGARGDWRRRICDVVLRACDEARDSFDGNPFDRSSQMSLV